MFNVAKASNAGKNVSGNGNIFANKRCQCQYWLSQDDNIDLPEFVNA
jgi:hypothetical protein